MIAQLQTRHGQQHSAVQHPATLRLVHIKDYSCEWSEVTHQAQHGQQQQQLLSSWARRSTTTI